MESFKRTHDLAVGRLDDKMLSWLALLKRIS